MRVRAIAAAILLASQLGCSSGTVQFVRPPAPHEDNTLGPNDIFAVRVYGEADLSQEYRIAADGSIDFPYIGRVHVQGLQPTEVADALRARLRDQGILRNPQVSVMTREINSRHVLVLGQVTRPGTFPYEQNMTIVQAITAAGGFTALADQRSVRLTRHGRGRSDQRSYTIPVDMIAEGRIGNVQIAPNDIIVVPQSAF